MRITLPPVFAIDESWDGNQIRQLHRPVRLIVADAANYASPGLKGKIILPAEGADQRILVLTKPAGDLKDFDRVIQTKLDGFEGGGDLDLSGAKWLKHSGAPETPGDLDAYGRRAEAVVASWRGAFSYLEEDPSNGTKGLRPPQAGAVHAVHAHWAVGDEPATIVMPTGTGKTETMLSVLVSKQCPKLLVVVPTDALRTQIANKFLTLGVLKEFGVASAGALYPIVGVLRSKPKSCDEVDEFFERCNVVVTTMQIAGQCISEVQERLAHHCPYLFIDEAHHVAAQTWRDFKQKFCAARTLQFTATPFRNDDRQVEGKPIFRYPLRKAQEEGYFKPINFKPVFEFDPRKADRVIAAKAVEQLREDHKKFDHVLMARVGSVDRANEVFAIYEKLYSEFNPVQIHTGIKSKAERERIRRMILSGESKIVVCVDMLGEGFDLPTLKVAAFHDVRKSLAVTLQLAGRFTRAKSDLGEATFIANLADVDVREELQKLYVQDADWNVLLRQSSEDMIEGQVALWEFIEGFKNFPDDLPLINMRPAMSTAIYRTRCQNWSPGNFREGIPGIDSFERVHHDINLQKQTLVIVTARRVPVDWAQNQDIYNWDWELYVLFWDEEQNLLFINNSNNGGYYRRLAEAVAGDGAELVSGPAVFRCLAGVNRLRLQNVGLGDQIGRLVRYTMRAGADVELGLTEAQKRNAVKKVIFGAGYEGGGKTTVGCSFKGRVWSSKVTNIEALTRWCRAIGEKVLDETIDPDEILKGTLVSVPVSERPRKMPIGVDWPEVVYKEPETAFRVIVDGGTELRLYETDIELIEPAEEGDIRLGITSGETSVELVLTLFEKAGAKDYRFSVAGDRGVTIRHGNGEEPLEDLFYEHPPVVWFADGSSLEGNLLTEPNRKFAPYPADKIRAWDWSRANIRKESQGITREDDSIQFNVIEELKKGDYDIIFDDDDSGEAADVVTVRVRDGRVEVEFYHCKFSTEDFAGARVKDLYEVCGQAQKSVRWMENPTELFAHLLRREPRREKGSEATRFERGDRDGLFRVKEMSRLMPVEVKVFIVQPGLSAKKASAEQLELLSVTENYLMETYKLPFGVIASA